MHGVEKPFFPIIGAGLLTTFLTLLGVYLLNVYAPDVNIMGWYANRIIPVGALLVGLLAASGYGIASWMLGIKINKMLLVSILLLQLGAYVVAQYIEYQDILNQMKQAFKTEPGALAVLNGLTFWNYLDESARSIAWADPKGLEPAPMGAWGYGVRALEVIGFCAGGMITPIALSSHPFCEKCQRYMGGKTVTVVPASIPAALFKKPEEGVLTKALETGMADLEALQAAARAGNARDFREIVGRLKSHQAKAGQLPLRFTVDIVRCPTCSEGYLRVARLETKGNNVERVELPERIVLPPDFTKEFA